MSNVSEATSRVVNHFHQKFVAGFIMNGASDWKEEHDVGSFDNIVFEPHTTIGLRMHAFGKSDGKDFHVDIIHHPLFDGYVCSLDEEREVRPLLWECSSKGCITPLLRTCQREDDNETGVVYGIVGEEDFFRYKKWKPLMIEALSLYMENVPNKV